MGFSYVESYNVPIWQRHWFIERIQKEIKKTSDENDGQGAATHAMHHNTPDIRSMMNRHRSMVPAKLRRFT